MNQTLRSLLIAITLATLAPIAAGAMQQGPTTKKESRFAKYRRRSLGAIALIGLSLCPAGANAEATVNDPAPPPQVDEDQTADADSARNSQPAEKLTARVDKAASEAVSVVVDVLEGLEKEKDEVFDRAAVTSFAEEFVDIACKPYVNYLHGLDDPSERHIEWVETSVATSVPIFLLSPGRSARPLANWGSKEKAREYGRTYADRLDRHLQHIKENKIDPRLVDESFALLFDLQERAFRRIMEHLDGKQVVVRANFPPSALAGNTEEFVSALENQKQSILSDLSFESERTIAMEKSLHNFFTYGNPSAQDRMFLAMLRMGAPQYEKRADLINTEAVRNYFESVAVFVEWRYGLRKEYLVAAFSMPVIATPDLYPLVDVASMTMEQQNDFLDRHVEDFIAKHTRQDGSIDLVSESLYFTAVRFHLGLRQNLFQIPEADQHSSASWSSGLREREFTFISPFPPEDSDQ